MDERTGAEAGRLRPRSRSAAMADADSGAEAAGAFTAAHAAEQAAIGAWPNAAAHGAGSTALAHGLPTDAAVRSTSCDSDGVLSSRDSSTYTTDQRSDAECASGGSPRTDSDADSVPLSPPMSPLSRVRSADSADMPPMLPRSRSMGLTRWLGRISFGASGHQKSHSIDRISFRPPDSSPAAADGARARSEECAGCVQPPDEASDASRDDASVSMPAATAPRRSGSRSRTLGRIRSALFDSVSGLRRSTDSDDSCSPVPMYECKTVEEAMPDVIYSVTLRRAARASVGPRDAPLATATNTSLSACAEPMPAVDPAQCAVPDGFREHRRSVRAASLDKLVELLTGAGRSTDEMLLRIFLTTYRPYCSPEHLMQLLMARFSRTGGPQTARCGADAAEAAPVAADGAASAAATAERGFTDAVTTTTTSDAALADGAGAGADAPIAATTSAAATTADGIAATVTTPLPITSALAAVDHACAPDAIAREAIRLRTAAVFATWLAEYPGDFSRACVEMLREFVAREMLDAPQLRELGEQIMRGLERTEPAATAPRRLPCTTASATDAEQRPSTEWAGEQWCCLASIAPRDVAAQLTYLDAVLYLAIAHSECLGSAWMRSDKQLRAASVVATIHQVRCVSAAPETSATPIDRSPTRSVTLPIDLRAGAVQPRIRPCDRPRPAHAATCGAGPDHYAFHRCGARMPQHEELLCAESTCTVREHGAVAALRQCTLCGAEDVTVCGDRCRCLLPHG